MFYDPRGNHGKTWLTQHLWERGQACVVPRSNATPEKMSAFLCSNYHGEEYVILDLPRASKIPTGLYEVIEDTKDGLVFDHRYHGITRNIRGHKLIVFTNTKLDTRKLSQDRWRLHGIDLWKNIDQEEEICSITVRNAEAKCSTTSTSTH